MLVNLKIIFFQKSPFSLHPFHQPLGSLPVLGRHPAGDVRQHRGLRLRIRRGVLLTDLRAGQGLHQKAIRLRTEVRNRHRNTRLLPVFATLCFLVAVAKLWVLDSAERVANLR